MTNKYYETDYQKFKASLSRSKEALDWGYNREGDFTCLVFKDIRTGERYKLDMSLIPEELFRKMVRSAVCIADDEEEGDE